VNLLAQVIPEWIELVSLASTTGVVVCLLWVLPPDAPSGRGTVLERMRQLLGLSVAVLFGSSILGLLLRAAEMSGRPITAVLAVVTTVVLRTHLGNVWIVRMAALATFAAVMMATWRGRHSRPLSYLMLGCTAVMSATESASGHASDAGDFSVAELMDWLHLVGPIVWGGGLLVLSVAILPRLVREGDRAARAMALVATRFSAIAAVAVTLIALTAVYQAWTYASSAEALVRSRYGQTIIAKIFLFSLLLCLGSFNRYVSVPRLQEWAGSTKPERWVLGRLIAPALRPLAGNARGPLVARMFARSVNVEALLLVTTLLCAALLRHEMPARHAPHRHATASSNPLRPR
jgi:copper resistance protein D